MKREIQVCEICFKQFKFKKTLYQHYEKFHAEDFPFRCSCCDAVQSFKSFSGLKKHVLLIKKRGQLNFIPCPICFTLFKYQTELDKHLKSDHGDGSPYICDYCNVRFKRRNSLMRHYKSHQQGSIFVCEICSKRFRRNDNLKIHIRRVHSTERPFVCNFCEKGFAEKGEMLSHVRIHTGEKPFQCEFCASAFAARSALKKHIRRHTGERPYSCEVCDKRFKSSSAMRRHWTKHFVEYPYGCPTCGEAFKRPEAWNAHLKVHVKCELIEGE